jgi:hypothetical protein
LTLEASPRLNLQQNLINSHGRIKAKKPVLTATHACQVSRDDKVFLGGLLSVTYYYPEVGRFLEEPYQNHYRSDQIALKLTGA